jgi:hypothetical protein
MYRCRDSTKVAVEQCCPKFLYTYIGAHLTDGCGGAGACGDCNNNNDNNKNKKVILIKITTDFIFMTVFPEIF